MSYRELVARFDREIHGAREHECVHRVEALASKDLRFEDYDSAAKQLERNFYISRRVIGP